MIHGGCGFLESRVVLIRNQNHTRNQIFKLHPPAPAELCGLEQTSKPLAPFTALVWASARDRDRRLRRGSAKCMERLETLHLTGDHDDRLFREAQIES